MEKTVVQDTLTGIRLGIAGEWQAAEMAECINVCNDMYNAWASSKSHWPHFFYLEYGQRRGADDIRPYEPLALMSRRIMNIDHPHVSHLIVRRIQYGSPGIIDLMGEAAVIGPCVVLILGVFKYTLAWQKQRVELKGTEIENAKQLDALITQRQLNRLRLVTETISMQSAKIDSDVIRHVAFDLDRRLEVLETYIIEGKLTSVAEIDGD